MERAENVETLTHQRWSGAELADNQVNIVSGGRSATASHQQLPDDPFVKTKPRDDRAFLRGFANVEGAGSLTLAAGSAPLPRDKV